MVGFVLTGHGEFAPGLASAVEMVAGAQPHFAVVPFAEKDAATYADSLKQAIADMRAATDAVIVFVDLLGGTPFNEAFMAAADIDGVEVVTGVNLPMLIECVIARSEGTSAESLVETAVAVGADGIAHRNMADLQALTDGQQL